MLKSSEKPVKRRVRCNFFVIDPFLTNPVSARHQPDPTQPHLTHCCPTHHQPTHPHLTPTNISPTNLSPPILTPPDQSSTNPSLPNLSLPNLSHARSPDLSLDTHIDELLSFSQNVNKLLFMFTKCKQTRKLKNKHTYSLGLDISVDTHNEDLLPFFKMYTNHCLCL
jgi:hypothetical protein